MSPRRRGFAAYVKRNRPRRSSTGRSLIFMRENAAEIRLDALPGWKRFVRAPSTRNARFRPRRCRMPTLGELRAVESQYL